MKFLIQRVSRARVVVSDETVGAIDRGLVVFVGITHGDTRKEANDLIEQLLHIRIFADTDNTMNLALSEVGGSVLIVPQFTLYANTSQGRRPFFGDAAPPHEAEPLFDHILEQLHHRGVPNAAGHFGAIMQVELINDGPVTIMLEKIKMCSG